MDLDELKGSVSQMIESCVTGEPPFWESMDNRLAEAGPAYVLGRIIAKDNGGVEEIKDYVRSRLWFTYRKNFAPIGGTGPESDQGWGCMLRCAQMLLGETLLRRHIGRNFRWQRGTEPSGDYEQILRMFFDEKSALYSIHQIAQMGVSEGKAVGEWFGPNTAAQVIKKLAIFDTWSDIAVHVALDNVVVDRDVKTIATLVPPTDAVNIIMEDGNVDESFTIRSGDGEQKDEGKNGARSRTRSSTFVEKGEWRPLLLIVPLRLGLTAINKCYLEAITEFFKLDSCVGIIGGRPNHALYFVGIAGERLIYLDPHYCRPTITTSSSSSMLSDFGNIDSNDQVGAVKEPSPNSIQSEDVSSSEAAKTSKVLRSHAAGFDDGFSQLEELEPLPSSLSSNEELRLDDTTYHCPFLLHMNYNQVDPSLALAFFCQTEDDYTKLRNELKEKVLPASSPPLFEQVDQRPSYWPPFEPYVGVTVKIEMKDFDDMGAPNYDIDDGFELLEE